jgi:uncharacterized protein (DUF433 family)
VDIGAYIVVLVISYFLGSVPAGFLAGKARVYFRSDSANSSGYTDTMNDMERITINPNQCGGRPCIRGMRIRVKDVLDMLAGGATQEEILADFPDLQAEDIRVSIAYAARYLDHTVLVAA